MNLVAGVTSFPILVRFDVSLARSEDAVRRMEAQGTDEEPCDQLRSSCSGHTPTCAPCLGSLEL